MATEALKSTPITNLDADPIVYMTPGSGGAGVVRAKFASVTATTGVTSGSTYQMVRLKSKDIVLQIYAWLTASVTTFTCDLGAYYSTSTKDGTAVANQGDVIDADFWGSAIALASIVTMTEYTTETATYTAAKRVQPLWQALGLSADPGGYIDIVLTNTATNSGAPVANMLVYYVDTGS